MIQISQNTLSTTGKKVNVRRTIEILERLGFKRIDTYAGFLYRNSRFSIYFNPFIIKVYKGVIQ